MFWIRDQIQRKQHEVAVKKKSTKVSGYYGGTAISSRVPRVISAALFRSCEMGSVGFSVLFMRNFLSFCGLYRSLKSKSIFREWNA